MSWRDRPAQARGVVAAARNGHNAARVLAIADSRAFVRSLFLASLADVGLAPALRARSTVPELAAAAGAVRVDRLQAWLDVGRQVGELTVRDGRWKVRGRRARAIADGDTLLTAHYRSMVEYQTGPYAHLASLLREGSGQGRTDLADHAATIADVSLAAAPFITPFLADVVAERRPRRALDIGCGTGVYTRALLDADGTLTVDGLDLAADVVAASQAGLDADGYGARARLSVGDVRTWHPANVEQFDLVTLCNNIYYFAPDERVSLFRRLQRFLASDGELVVVSLARAGSIAGAHLHLMLCCQDGAAALPELGDIERLLHESGYDVVASKRLVPTEPFVGVRARIR